MGVLALLAGRQAEHVHPASEASQEVPRVSLTFAAVVHVLTLFLFSHWPLPSLWALSTLTALPTLLLPLPFSPILHLRLLTPSALS